MARRDKKRNFKRRVAVVGDGVTEKIYFEQLKELERIKDVLIKPELPSKSSKGGSYKKPLNTAIQLVEDGYAELFIIPNNITIQLIYKAYC
ncbi:hypothetical protein GCM10027566_00830 [Arachidicoccus ginsenosidivorans]|jgi:hypothetical protein|uniref:RloB domain-containing protein n=1 Tax=Arachidicoccus ginsenosidivorans TaxID=496057 RepID=A0A5B8VSI9_9BACT|nr:RloB domain-containing protein [Arachidicoccus ginsenosidivorans]QEC73852.1 RloB domain-containing protein [Arachidicoccus ginsenosidivorans]